MNITLKDGSALVLADGASAFEAASQISAGLARAAMAARVNGEVRDLRLPLAEGDTLEILTGNDADGLFIHDIDLAEHHCGHGGSPGAFCYGVLVFHQR